MVENSARNAFSLALGIGMLALGGCDSSSTGADAGLGDGGPELSLPALTKGPLDAPDEAEADYSTLGTSVRPTGGDPVSTTFDLTDFQDGFEVGGVEVWVFDDNIVLDRCDAPHCQSFRSETTTGSGTVNLPAGGWYAYRVMPKAGPTPGTTVFAVAQYNETAPSEAGDRVEGNSVSGTTINLIPAVLGFPREEGTALIAGTILDGAGDSVYGTVIRVFDADGQPVIEGENNIDPHFNYFNGDDFPVRDQPFSHRDGLFIVTQLPVPDDDRPYRVEAWGMLDGTLSRLSCETARVFSDTVTILNLEPTRADAPEGCNP